MPPLPPNSAGPEGSVLLVEEYAALAAAINAALKKFAPRHGVQRVRSLPAALEIAFDAPPDLLILDFDPPLAGVLGFFNELRDACPAARVMIIAADLPHEILRDERLPTAFTFVDKPFRLEELGAAITRLIAPSDPGGEGRPSTTLEAFGLADMIPLLGIEGATGLVNVTAADGALVGELSFARGQIPHAAASGLQGIDALREMLRWPSPEFAFAPDASEAPRQIEGKWPGVLEKVLRSIPRPLPPAAARKRTGHRAAGKTARAQPSPPVVKEGKKVLVIDDTETLRIFVEEMLSTSDPQLRIVCAADAGEGLKQCASFLPDLILLDYSLPDFNGDEVCRRLLADKATSDIPIIMMSGHVAQMADAAERYENIVLTLSKPFVSRDLIEVVTKTLAHPPARRPRQPAPPPTPAKAEPLPTSTEQKTNGHAPAPAPALSPAPVSPPVSTLAPPSVPTPLSSPLTRLTPAHIPVASSDAVVLSLGLEVVSMQFSPALQITALRGRPVSFAVLLHVDPRAATAPLPEVAFEIAHVQLDARGQLHTLRLAPTTRPPLVLSPHLGVPIERLAILPPNGRSGLQITPAAAAEMTIQLLSAFDLAGVELSANFGVACFVLRARRERIRVVLPGQGARAGTIFETMQVLLDPAGRIAEVGLNALSN